MNGLATERLYSVCAANTYCGQAAHMAFNKAITKL